MCVTEKERNEKREVSAPGAGLQTLLNIFRLQHISAVMLCNWRKARSRLPYLLIVS